MMLALLCLLLQSARAPVGNWVYTSTHDQMRERKTQIAGLEAVNQAALGRPYRGVTRATLVVRKTGEYSFVHVIIENGVLSCSRCNVLVKIDERPATYWVGDAGESHSSLIIDAPYKDGSQREFNAAAEIAGAHQVQIEVPFYSKGAFQYNFLTASPLVWPSR